MSGRWTITAAVLVGLVATATVGCVPKQKFLDAQKAARLANEALETSQLDLQAERASNQKLSDDLAERDAALAANDKIVNNLKLANAEWKNKFEELHRRYVKLAGRDVLVPDSVIVLPIKMDAALRGLAKENPDLMDYMPKYGMIKLKADLTFGKGSAEVKLTAKAALKKLAEIVNTDEAKAFHVYAAGHTDDIPLVRRETIDAHGSNWGLSLHRAGAVVEVLADSGVTQRRMGAMGFSKYHPVAPNEAGNRGNPLNRRVEIWIVPPDRLLTASSVVQPEK